MDFTQLVQVISQVGFPIFCAVAMFIHLEKERDSHATESEKWIEALNNNTVVMERLLERFDKE